MPSSNIPPSPCYTTTMGLFGPTPPKRITKKEYDQVCSRLYGKLEKDEREEVEKLFRADLNESGVEAGISQVEFDTALEWLRNNQDKHRLEENDIALLETYFSEHLQD